ncbi:MAG: hypothetical protein K2N01_02675 [Lachnospiraceae bacterium]|nr:hypothetical protein [Lachnospiraceae bacterium]
MAQTKTSLHPTEIVVCLRTKQYGIGTTDIVPVPQREQEVTKCLLLHAKQKISVPLTAVVQRKQEPFMMCLFAIKRLMVIKHTANADF